MPDSVSSTHLWANDADTYFIMPAFPEARHLSTIFWMYSTDTAGDHEIWFGLTRSPTADAVSMSAASRVIDRGNERNDGKPVIHFRTTTNVPQPFVIPINHRLPSQGLSMIVGLNGPNLANHNVIVIASLLTEQELSSVFGIGRVVQTIGQAPSAIPGPPSSVPVG